MKKLILFLITISFIGCSALESKKELYLSETINYTCSDKEYSELIKEASQCIKEDKRAVEIFDRMEKKYKLTDKYMYLGFLQVADSSSFRNKNFKDLTKGLHSLKKMNECFKSSKLKCGMINYDYLVRITPYNSIFVDKVIPCKVATRKRHVEECLKAGFKYQDGKIILNEAKQ